MVDTDHAGVDGVGTVVERPLEQQVGRGVARFVRLEGAEVVHLVAVAEVEGRHPAGGATADEAAIEAIAGVVAAERDMGQTERRFLTDRGAHGTQLVGAGTPRVDRDQADPGGGADGDLDTRNDQCGRVGGGRPFDDLELGILSGVDDEPGQDEGTVGVDVGHDVERPLDGHAPRHAQEERVGPVRQVEVAERVGRDDVFAAAHGRGDDNATQGGVAVAQAAEANSLRCHRVVELGNHEVTVVQHDSAGVFAERRRDVERRRRHVTVGGRGDGVPIEVDVAHAAVAPLLERGVGEGRRSKAFGGRDTLIGEPLGARQRTSAGWGECVDRHEIVRPSSFGSGAAGCDCNVGTCRVRQLVPRR